MPEVSVIIASYNYARYLPTALDSVANQTFTDWECIIVDDASTDDTAEVVQPYLSDPRFHYFRNDVNSGVDISRNRANALAVGKYIACLDGDDWWELDKLAEQVDVLEGQPEAVVCLSAVNSVRDKAVTVYRPEAWWLADMALGLRISNEINHSSSLVLRDAILAVGGYNPLLPGCGDWNFFLKLIYHYGAKGFVYIDRPLINYRWHTSNLSHDWSRRNWSERAIIKSMLLGSTWGVRHPFAAVRVIHGQIDRELRRYISSANYSKARWLAVSSVLLAPAKRWRWRQLFDVIYQTGKPAVCPSKHG
jgi:glycosyltransferase involved in cell wall biosynthesis